MINATSALFQQWRDRVLAVAIVFVTLAAVRTWFIERPWPIASAQAFGAGIVGGIACGHLIRARLAFHATDGPLAADALRPVMRLRYAVIWHAAAVAMLAAVTMIVRPPLLIVSLPGYAAGIIIAHGAGGLGAKRPPFMEGGTRRRLRSWLRHPLAAVVSAIVLVVSLAMLSSPLTQEGLTVAAGVGAALLILVLTAVDDGLVRFMAIAGQGSWSSIARQGRGAALFLGIAVPACLLVFGPAPGSIVAATGAAGILLMVIRILAYRLHRKRAADFLVTAIISVLALAASAMFVMLPVVAVVIVWQLQRRANARTWMLV